MTLTLAWLLVPDGLLRLFQKLLITHNHLQGFTETGLGKTKYPVSRSSVGDNGQTGRTATVAQISTRYHQQDNAPCQKAQII